MVLSWPLSEAGMLRRLRKFFGGNESGSNEPSSTQHRDDERDHASDIAMPWGGPAPEGLAPVRAARVYPALLSWDDKKGLFSPWGLPKGDHTTWVTATFAGMLFIIYILYNILFKSQLYISYKTINLHILDFNRLSTHLSSC